MKWRSVNTANSSTFGPPENKDPADRKQEETDFFCLSLFLSPVVCQMLKKIPAALHQAQATPDAGLEPKRVRKGRAVSAGPGKVEKPAKRFEELDTNDCFTERLVMHEFSQN
jgi:hypothetical protein